MNTNIKHSELSLDRFCGCLLGLAVGDATGTTVEFSPPGSFPPVTDMVGGGPFNLKPGEWTDDTSMSLLLAESLLKKQGFDALDQMERYVRWWKKGYLSSNGRCFDIGITVAGALRRFQSTGNPVAGLTDPNSAGNGSLMRLAPVPMFFAADPAQAIELSGESSKTTHGVAEAVDACRYFGGLLVGALRGEAKETLLYQRYAPVAGYWEGKPLSPRVREIADGSFKRKKPPQIRGSGYVIHTLEAALWALNETKGFEQAVLRGVNLGEDSDSVAAVIGMLAGAIYGEQGVPKRWRNKLAHHDLIRGLAVQLHQQATKKD